jgi:hypothetical protein
MTLVISQITDTKLAKNLHDFAYNSIYKSTIGGSEGK